MTSLFNLQNDHPKNKLNSPTYTEKVTREPPEALLIKSKDTQLTAQKLKEKFLTWELKILQYRIVYVQEVVISNKRKTKKNVNLKTNQMLYRRKKENHLFYFTTNQRRGIKERPTQKNYQTGLTSNSSKRSKQGTLTINSQKWIWHYQSSSYQIKS